MGRSRACQSPSDRLRPRETGAVRDTSRDTVRHLPRTGSFADSIVALGPTVQRNAPDLPAAAGALPHPVLPLARTSVLRADVLSSEVTHRPLPVLSLILLGVFATASGCVRSDDEVATSPDRDPQVAPRKSASDSLTPPAKMGAEPIACRVGSKPSYFVPGGENGAIIGCARLAVSGRTVRFSADPEGIGRDAYVCLNPAYRGRGNPGFYIPAICARNPVPRGFQILAARVPRQGIRGYERVLWGFAPRDARQVVVRTGEVRDSAALLRVPGALGRRVGAPGAFTVFVAEVPRSFDCEDVIITTYQGFESRTGACP